MDEKWYQVIFETVIHEHESLAGNIPQIKGSEEFWITEKQLIIVSEKGILGVNALKKEFTVVNPKLKLYAKFPLPLNLLQIVSEITQLQLKYGNQFSGVISETEETKTIENKLCKKNLVIAEDTNRTKVEQWVTSDVPFNLDSYNELMIAIRRFKFPLFDDNFHESLNKKSGFPIFEEITQSIRGKKFLITKRMKKIKEKKPPKEIIEIPDDYSAKNRLFYSELTTQTLQAKKKYSSAEKKIVEFLHHYQNWYLNRDLARLEDWIKETFTEDSYIIGTNAIFPGTHEWRKGIQVAKEVYTNDFHNNWDLRIFIDEADIEVDGNFAWVAVFGLVTRQTADHPTRNADVSRKRSLARIKSMTEKDWESKRALYEIIHDASTILVQYERGDTYLWPVRCTYNLKKIDGKWKIKQLHYSWSGSGFPSARFYDEKKV